MDRSRDHYGGLGLESVRRVQAYFVETAHPLGARARAARYETRTVHAYSRPFWRQRALVYRHALVAARRVLIAIFVVDTRQDPETRAVLAAPLMAVVPGFREALIREGSAVRLAGRSVRSVGRGGCSFDSTRTAPILAVGGASCSTDVDMNVDGATTAGCEGDGEGDDRRALGWHPIMGHISLGCGKRRFLYRRSRRRMVTGTTFSAPWAPAAGWPSGLPAPACGNYGG